MSVEATNAIWHRKVSGTQQILLLALADHIDEDGICWPSLPYLAWKCNVDEKTIRRTMDKLIDLGYLTKYRRYKDSNVYRINFDSIPVKDQRPEVRVREARPDESTRLRLGIDDSPPMRLDIQSTRLDINEPRLDIDDVETGHGRAQNDAVTINQNHQSEPSEERLELSPKKNAPRFEEEALYQELRQDKRTKAALRVGRVPVRKYDDAIIHAADEAIAHNATVPASYALKILSTYYERPWYEETPEERLARGRTAREPG